METESEKIFEIVFGLFSMIPIYFLFSSIYYRFNCAFTLSNEFNKNLFKSLSDRDFIKTYLPKSKQTSSANKYNKLFIRNAIYSIISLIFVFLCAAVLGQILHYFGIL